LNSNWWKIHLHLRQMALSPKTRAKVSKLFLLWLFWQCSNINDQSYLLLPCSSSQARMALKLLLVVLATTSFVANANEFFTNLNWNKKVYNMNKDLILIKVCLHGCFSGIAAGFGYCHLRFCMQICHQIRTCKCTLIKMKSFFALETFSLSNARISIWL